MVCPGSFSKKPSTLLWKSSLRSIPPCYLYHHLIIIVILAIILFSTNPFFPSRSRIRPSITMCLFFLTHSVSPPTEVHRQKRVTKNVQKICHSEAPFLPLIITIWPSSLTHSVSPPIKAPSKRRIIMNKIVHRNLVCPSKRLVLHF